MDRTMFKANHQNEEQSDRTGRLVLLAAARNDDEIEAAATSPFLYTRLRARIVAVRAGGATAGFSQQCRTRRPAMPGKGLLGA